MEIPLAFVLWTLLKILEILSVITLEFPLIAPYGFPSDISLGVLSVTSGNSFGIYFEKWLSNSIGNSFENIFGKYFGSSLVIN